MGTTQSDHSPVHRLTLGIASLGLILFTSTCVDSYSNGLHPAAQPAHQEAQGSHMDRPMAMPITMTSERITIGPEFLPRRSDLPNNLIVPAGQTVELAADTTYDYIEVAGTLRVSRTQDTTTRFTHLVVLPGGNLDVGTQADPIPCDRRVDFTVRDVPIDTRIDPYQWGNGLVNFGHQSRVGCSKTSVVQASGSIPAGATSITLASAPTGWQVGDELLIPDTTTPAYNPAFSSMPRRESRVTIAAIDGASLRLSKGLDFAHPNIADPQGVVVLRPRVANLTRNILIHSENPAGTRGHTANIGHGATWDIRFNRFIGLGRTQNIALDDYVAATGRVGTNQRGKYTEHHHHVGSSVGSADVGNVYVAAGRPLGKWGLVVHGTSDTTVADNITLDFPGAGIVTEDGYEVRNVFRRNFAVGSIGNAEDSRRNAENLGCPGCEGTGFWFRGNINTVEGNEAWNNRTGMNLFNQDQQPGMFPGKPGGALDTPLTPHHLAFPVSVADNVMAANSNVGVEMWALLRFPHNNLTAANNTKAQFFAVSSDGIETYLRNPRIICTTGTSANGVDSNQDYVGNFEMEGGQIAGCAVGLHGGGGAHSQIVKGTTFQNQVNIDDLCVQGAVITDVMHVPLANYPHQYVLLGDGAVWDGKDPLRLLADAHAMIPQRGSRWTIKNWQGTGKDYLLFYKQSLGNNPAAYSSIGGDIFNTPVKGLTLQESWEKFGIGYFGDMLKNSEAISLDGLVNGFARAGLIVPFSPPRAVVTYPTMRQSAAIEDGTYIHLYALLTGDPNGASDIMMASIDGGTPVAIPHRDGWGQDDRTMRPSGPQISPGVHTVKVWRTQKDKPTVLLAGSEYTSQYCIGSCPGVPQGHISLSTNTVNFSAVSGGATATSQTVTLSNTGTASLAWSVRLNQNWCHASRMTVNLPAGASTPITVFVDAPSNVGSFSCNMTISDTTADNTPQTVTVNYTVAGPGTPVPPPAGPKR